MGDELPFEVTGDDSQDIEWRGYEQRASSRFAEAATGSFLKFGKHMVQRLDRIAFEARLAEYQDQCKRCDRMLASGATLSEAVMLDVEEAASWLLLPSPNLFDLFEDFDAEAL